MEVIREKGEDDIARVYLGRCGEEGKFVEFVDSLGGAESRRKKWVIIVSSLFGCPVGCRFCDAGRFYNGKVCKDRIMEQVDHIVKKHRSTGDIDSDKFKVQFARMGEPAYNDDVIKAIPAIQKRYEPKNYMPCITTIAPSGRENWFERVKELNHDIVQGSFQLQFSIHSTKEEQRDFLMPVEKWSLDEIAEYGENFYAGGRKVTLNFALSEDNTIDAEKMRKIFDPDYFAVKITPLNPTLNAEENKLVNVFTEKDSDEYPVIERLEEEFDVYLSIGMLEENEIKSNCGQILLSYLDQEH